MRVLEQDQCKQQVSFELTLIVQWAPRAGLPALGRSARL